MASGVGTAFLIATIGLGALAGMRLSPEPGAERVAVLALPRQPGGLIWAAQFDLPVVDLLWNGRLVVLDLSGEAGAMARLQGTGLVVLDASSVTGCLGLGGR